MRLNELFSPIGAPEENQDINWLEDLKFFMDNDNEVTSNVMFPAIKKHKKYNPQSRHMVTKLSPSPIKST